MQLFQEVAPDVSQAFMSLVQSLGNIKGLDPKTKEIVYIGIKASMGDSQAVQYHVPIAKKLGATKEELIDTVIQTLPIVGLKGVTSCLPIIIETYDRV